MSILEFEAPLPPRALSPNVRSHWAAKAAWVESYAATVAYAATAARVAHPGGWQTAGKVRISLLFGTKVAKHERLAFARCRDVDNALASFKAGIDGLVRAGIMPDDGHRFVAYGDLDIEPSQGPWVRVKVEKVADGPVFPGFDPKKHVDPSLPVGTVRIGGKIVKVEKV